MDLKDRIKSLRKAKNLSQSELGKKVNLSLVVISGIETGKTDPSTKQLKALSEFFNVSIDYLVTGVESERTISESEQEIIQAVRQDNALLNTLKEAIELKKKVLLQIKRLSHRDLEEQQLEHT